MVCGVMMSPEMFEMPFLSSVARDHNWPAVKAQWLKMRPKLTHAPIVPTAAMAIGTRTQLRREKARTAERRGGPAMAVLNRPIMDALLKECWNLLGVIGAANLVLVDGRRFRFRDGGDT